MVVNGGERAGSIYRHFVPVILHLVFFLNKVGALNGEFKSANAVTANMLGSRRKGEGYAKPRFGDTTVGECLVVKTRNNWIPA